MSEVESQPETRIPAKEHGFSAAEIGALSHLYRGEIYRSTMWRTRLDSTTNWAVLTTGIALSATFSSPEASPLPLILVGLIVVTFLMIEARRYRYFNVWRARARLLETDFYAPLLEGQGFVRDNEWTTLLAKDLRYPRYHIRYSRAVGRRLQRTYAWIFLIQAIAYCGKIAIHPSAVHSVAQVLERAAIGPLPGQAVVLMGVLFHASWIAFALWTRRIEQRAKGKRQSVISMG
jgi:uncharacterized membrane protein